MPSFTARLALFAIATFLIAGTAVSVNMLLPHSVARGAEHQSSPLIAQGAGGLPPAATPTPSLTADRGRPAAMIESKFPGILAGGKITISWSSRNADSCIVRGPGLAESGVSGSKFVGPLSQDSIYRIRCTSSQGDATAETTVLVKQCPRNPRPLSQAPSGFLASLIRFPARLLAAVVGEEALGEEEDDDGVFDETENEIKINQALLVGSGTASISLPDPARLARAPVPMVKVFSASKLAESRAKIAAGDPTMIAARDAYIQAVEQSALNGPIVTVVERKNPPPPATAHDFFSISRYFWPSRTNASGYPNEVCDGRTNPDYYNYDIEGLFAVQQNVERLGLAYYFTGDEKYARRAAEMLRAYFLDPDTRMNPNMNYAVIRPGTTFTQTKNTIQGTGFIKMLEGVALIEGSPSWTAADDRGLKAWFRHYRNWLQSLKNDATLPARVRNQMNNGGNNIYSWYDAQIARMSLYIDDPSSAAQIIRDARTKRIASQILPTGQMPRETRRVAALGYTMGGIEALEALAAMGNHVGVDLWGYRTNDGRSLEKAVLYIAPYLDQSKTWPHGDNNMKGTPGWDRRMQDLAEKITVFHQNKPNTALRNILAANDRWWTNEIEEVTWRMYYDALPGSSSKSSPAPVFSADPVSATSTSDQPPALPTATLAANPASITKGQSTTLTWSSTNATSCAASGGWSGTKATSGSQTFANLASSTTYTLTCAGSGGSVTVRKDVAVQVPPQTTFSIAGIVWEDVNGNKAINGATASSQAEPRLSGRTVTLKNETTGAILGTKVTNAQGKYLFPALKPGTYRVIHSVPTGFVRTTDNSAVIQITNANKAHHFGVRRQ